MFGVWISNLSQCNMSIEITKGRYGTYKSNSPYKGCGAAPVRGKVRFTNSHLYIGLVKYKFISKPENLNTNDSIGGIYNYNVVSGKIIAKMTLQNSKLHTSEIITYYKIIEY